jgi:hypothetical protein
LDAIIAQIYPNLDEFEAKEVSMIEQINKEVMQNGTLLENVELGKKRQALAKAMRPVFYLSLFIEFLFTLFIHDFTTRLLILL